MPAPKSRRPLGVAVVGGLLFSQIITLYITPVVYTYLDAWQKRLARRKVTEPRQFRSRAPESASAAGGDRMSAPGPPRSIRLRTPIPGSLEESRLVRRGDRRSSAR